MGLLALDPLDAPELLHRLAEVAVIVSFLAPAGRTTEQVNQVVAPAPRTYVGESREVPSWPWGTKSSKGSIAVGEDVDPGALGIGEGVGMRTRAMRNTATYTDEGACLGRYGSLRQPASPLLTIRRRSPRG